MSRSGAVVVVTGRSVSAGGSVFPQPRAIVAMAEATASAGAYLNMRRLYRGCLGGLGCLGCLRASVAGLPGACSLLPDRGVRLQPDSHRSVRLQADLLRNKTMPRGDTDKYTDRQKRQAEHIEEGYRERGVSEGEAERRADEERRPESELEKALI